MSYQDGPEIVFTDHAIDRYCQRFRHLGADDLLPAFGRSRWVTARTLKAEARHCGKPMRITAYSLYARDEQTGCLFVLKADARKPNKLIVVTIIKSPRPKGFVELE